MTPAEQEAFRAYVALTSGAGQAAAAPAPPMAALPAAPAPAPVYRPAPAPALPPAGYRPAAPPPLTLTPKPQAPRPDARYGTR
jgi:hypothetical protein